MSTAALGSDQAGEFENYSHTSQVYDARRRPCCIESAKESVRVAAANCGKKASEVRLLDVGCGTGNYLAELHRDVGAAAGLEFNEGMLGQAKAKGMAGVELEQGSCLDIKKADGSFDMVMMTQVLHHIEAEHHQKAFDEMARVLAPGGTLWLQTSFPRQIMEGFWWAAIVPQAAAQGAARFPGEPLLRRMLDDAGFDEIEVSSETKEPLMGLQYYLDKEGPLKEEYRNGDSSWARATPEELEAGQVFWRGKLADGSADAFLAEREALRAKVGQSTCVRAVKRRAVRARSP